MIRMRPRFHHVFANRSNIGDLLAAQGIQSLLGVDPIEHLCDDPFVAETVSRLHALAPDDLVVVGGGGLVMDYFVDLWHGLDSDRFKARLVLWGVGSCDLKNEMTRPPLDVLRRVAGKALVCVPRDELTRTFLGTSTAPVPCPSILRLDPAPGGGSGLLHVANYTTVGGPAYNLMREAGLAYAAATGTPYVETDNRIASSHQVPESVARYHQAAVVLSSALHGCILAVAAGRPVLAVSGDWKIEAFMGDAGLGDWVLDAADAAAVATRLVDLPTQRPVPAFVEQVRRQNTLVSSRVRSLMHLA